MNSKNEALENTHKEFINSCNKIWKLYKQIRKEEMDASETLVAGSNTYNVSDKDYIKEESDKFVGQQSAKKQIEDLKYSEKGKLVKYILELLDILFQGEWEEYICKHKRKKDKTK